VFSIVEYDICSCLLLFILHLHNSAAAETDILKTFLGSSTVSSERATSRLLVETSFSAASTRFYYDYETFSHVIKL
jgi:hypothetical protein